MRFQEILRHFEMLAVLQLAINHVTFISTRYFSNGFVRYTGNHITGCQSTISTAYRFSSAFKVGPCGLSHSCEIDCLQSINKAMISIVSSQKGPTRHAYAWQIGPFWQDTLDIWISAKVASRMFQPSLGLIFPCGWIKIAGNNHLEISRWSNAIIGVLD